MPPPRNTPDTPQDAPVYLVVGDEYLVSADARELVDRLCPPDEQALGLEIVDGRADTVADAEAALEEALQGLRTMGFFGGRKTVWLREATFLAQKRVAGSDAIKQRVASLTADIKSGLPEGVRLVISAPGLDKRSALYKACDGHGVVHEYAVADKPWLAERQARERAGQLMAEEGLKAAPGALDALIGKAGTDTRQIAQEIGKLAVYLGVREEVTVDDVREIVAMAREAMAWDFVDAVGARDLPLALSILRQLIFQNVNAMVMLMALESRFRELVIFRECLSKKWCVVRESGNYVKLAWAEDPSMDEVLGVFEPDPRKMHEFRAARLAQQAANYSRRELVQAQNLVVETHEHIISRSLRGDLQMEFLVLKVLSAAPTAVG